MFLSVIQTNCLRCMDFLVDEYELKQCYGEYRISVYKHAAIGYERLIFYIKM